MHKAVGGGDVATMVAGARRIVRAWRGLRVEYGWLPPFEGVRVTRPNRLEVVFSGHPAVAVEQGGTPHTVDVLPGAGYVVGGEPTVLRRVREHSDTLEIYPDMALLRSAAEREGVRDFALEPTLRRETTILARDPVLLGVAHVLRRACMGTLALADAEASALAHRLAQHVLLMQYGIRSPRSRPGRPRLDARAMRALTEFIEEHLAEPLTLEDLADRAAMSPFHFARCFKRTAGMAPHQYVLARRIELAKRLLLTTGRAVQDIAWSAGFENVSHFRRKFVDQVGVHPGALRRATAASS